MDEGTSLDELLNADLSPEPEAAPEPVQETVERPRDEHGRFAAKETGVEPPAETQEDAVPPTDRLPKEEYKAIREEREKRQAIEKELEALRTQIQQFQTQQTQQTPQPEPPSLWEDENGWGNNLVNVAVQQAELRSQVKMSEMLMRQAEPDFENLKTMYLELERANPSIGAEVMADPHPWNKAIQIAKNHKAMKDLGAVDVNDLREKLKAEIMAELGSGQAPVSERPTVPASLTGERSVAARSGPAWAGPTPLSELLR